MIGRLFQKIKEFLTPQPVIITPAKKKKPSTRKPTTKKETKKK